MTSDNDDTAETNELLTTADNNNRSFRSPTSPADRVRFLLSDESDTVSSLGTYRPLFCQLDVLCNFPDGCSGWKEISRWLKYEECVDQGNRWSKPHVSTTSLHGLMEVRGQLANNKACVVLDLDPSHSCSSNGTSNGTSKDDKKHASSYADLEQYHCTCKNAQAKVMELLSAEIGTQKKLSSTQIEQLKKVLLAPHKHQHRTGKAQGGKNESNDSFTTYPSGMTPDSLKTHKTNKQFSRKLMKGTETVNVLVGEVDFLDSPLVVLVRLGKSCILGDLSEVNAPTRFMAVSLTPTSPGSNAENEEIGRALGALFTDKVFTEVVYKARTSEDVLHGLDEFIDGLTVLPPSVWDPAVRLEPPTKTMTESKVRRRLDNEERYSLMKEDIEQEDHADESLKRTGRLFGGMINDMKRRYPQYLSDLRDGLHLQCVAAVVFLYFACVSAIITFGGLMGTATDQYMGTMESMMSGAICGLIYHSFSGQPLTIVGATGPLLVFESIMFQLCKDYEWDFLTFRFYTGMWVAIILFVIVAFDLSALVGYITRFTEESFSVLISFIFIAQAFKKVVGVWDKYPIHTGVSREDLGFKCYCVPPQNSTEGTQTTAAQLLATVSEDLNATEPVSKFIYDTYNRSVLIAKDCITVEDKLRVAYGCISETSCTEHGWALEGPGCESLAVTHGTPDVFLVSVMLFVTTFGVAYLLRSFRNANFFPAFVRNTVADFAVLISILCSVGLDYAIGINTPKLQVPSEFKLSRDDRPWVVNPADVTVWWLIPLSLIPAIFATILIFLDQQITAVIVNRKDHKLKKGHGYHLDLFVLATLVAICSTLGLPWFVAATVRSITHVKALLRQSDHTAPGEKPTFLGVREQRLTGICIHILIGASVLLTAVLKFVPMAVLYGVFLYMGITSLFGVQFFDRMLIMLMPAKYQPDYVYLRHVPIRRVHIFTLIQIVCMIIMWTLKSIKAVSITFPLMILALCFVRKGMERFMSDHDLFWLDNLLPEITRRKKEDEANNELDEKKEMKSAV